MTVSDLTAALQLQNPCATVVLHDPSGPDMISKLGVAEVQAVPMGATEEFEIVWLQIADKDDPDSWPGVILGSGA